MFRRATEEEGNAAVRDSAEVIADWLLKAKRIYLTQADEEDLADILQQKLGDRLGTNEEEVGQ